jgi:hypothetical protein
LHFKYFRCYGHQKCILSSDPKYEMVGKNTSVPLMYYDVTMYNDIIV